MLELAAAEFRYNRASILAWVSVLLVVSLWPLVEAGGLRGVPTVLAVMMLGLPLVTPVSCFLLLNVERTERRQRMWSMMPVAPAAVAGARLLRAAVLPLLAATLAIALIVPATVFVGCGIVRTAGRFLGPWFPAVGRCCAGHAGDTALWLVGNGVRAGNECVPGRGCIRPGCLCPSLQRSHRLDNLFRSDG